MPRSVTFYFGTILFFVGLLLLATGVAAAIREAFSFIVFAELISGVILMVIGFRATNRPKQAEPS